jgi:hypothetical protein
MRTVDDVSAHVTLGHRFVDAIVTHDWDGLAACFAPDARLVAVVPKESAFRERSGREAAAGQLQAWFGDADFTELLGSEVEWPMADLRIVYRIHEHSPTVGTLSSRSPTRPSGPRASRT